MVRMSKDAKLHIEIDLSDDLKRIIDYLIALSDRERPVSDAELRMIRLAEGKFEI